MKNTFFDFCSGIGGGRLGLEHCGLECVGHSEIDPNPAKTYELFFGNYQNFGDLMKIEPSTLPDFRYLIAGFPCQTFSIVGKREGFSDDRGQIIFGIQNILQAKNPPFFLLENVKGLLNHNRGKTLQTIVDSLTALGYIVRYRVLNSLDFGLPQMRERIYIVGIKNELYTHPFDFPQESGEGKIEEFLCDETEEFDIQNPTFIKYLNNAYNKGKINLEEILQEDYNVIDTRQSDCRIYPQKVPTLRTGRHGILYTKDKKLKKLSSYEGLLLQGFPKNLAEKIKNLKNIENKILSQVGNAMSVPVIEAIGKKIKEYDND
ncbi:DNA (cytosine-5-)-methyltransferase [Helicobacter brantae]|uniref:DNA (cytosine-5-)-methyltransferase n=1 Tax=Helicobacter brantae TaxID=375927 RepID=A0A3D8J285_9HELI|nr:DNA (cytosine-5-)-methyltransferase [Helicobacter brantae]RDU71503.1 DNA (cytosine-5-)-methyltransferase [Helicobacter brantae]